MALPRRKSSFGSLSGNSMAIEIQPLCADNYHAAFAIQQQCHFNPWSEKVFADCLSEPYFAFQMLEKDVTKGYYVAMDVVGEATLMDIGVGIESRGKGLGAVLLGHFIQTCIEKGSEEIWLEVRASNHPAIRLYKNVGFELIEIRKEYYPSEQGKEDALVMKKSLT